MANRYWVGSGSQSWNSTANWSSTSGGPSGSSVPTAADDVFFDANSNIAINPNVNINVSPTASCRRIDFRAYTKAVTMSNALTVGAAGSGVTGSLILGSGMIITGSAGINTRGNTWFDIISNGKHWPNSLGLANVFTTGITTPRVVISGSDLTVSGTLTLNTTTAADLTISTAGSGGPFNIILSGSLTNSAAAFSDTITSIASGQKIIFKGPGTWSANSINTSTLRSNVDIDTGPSTLTITNVGLSTGKLNYLSGTVIHTGTFALFDGTTLNVSGSTSPFAITSSNEGVNFNNLQIRDGTNLGVIYTFSGSVCVVDTFSTRTNSGTTSNTARIILRGGTIYINKSFNHGIFEIPPVTPSSNSTKLVLQTPTTGTWSDNYATAVGTGRVGTATPIDIACSGTLIVTQSVGIQNGCILRYITGSVVTTNSTLICSNLTMTISASGVTWNNLRIVPNSPTNADAIVNFDDDHTFTGNFINGTTTTGNEAITNGGNIYIGGNYSVPSITTGLSNGTATFVLIGPGTMSMNPSVTTGEIESNITFNNGANTFYLSGSFRYGNGIMTYTNGNIDATTYSSNLILTAPSTLVDMGNVTLYDLRLVGTNIITINGSSPLFISNTLTWQNSAAGTLTITGSTGWTANNVRSSISFYPFALALGSQNTYTINNSLILRASNTSSVYSITSTSIINRPRFTLSPGATQDLWYISSGDGNAGMDSSNGLPIFTRGGTISTDTSNWYLMLEPKTIQKSFMI
jgi:hypothetical protein